MCTVCIPARTIIVTIVVDVVHEDELEMKIRKKEREREREREREGGACLKCKIIIKCLYRLKY